MSFQTALRRGSAALRSGRAGRAASLLLPSVLAAVLVSALVAPGATTASQRPATVKPLGVGGMIRAAFTGGATITMTVPVQTAAGNASGATFPITSFQFKNSAPPPAAGSTAGGGKPTGTFSFGHVPDAYSIGLTRPTFKGTPLTGVTITIKNALVTGQTAPETLRFSFASLRRRTPRRTTARRSSGNGTTRRTPEADFSPRAD